MLDKITGGFCTGDSPIRCQRGADYDKSVLKAEMNTLERSVMKECERLIANSAQGGERTASTERMLHEGAEWESNLGAS